MKLYENKEITVHLRISQSEYDRLKFVVDFIGWFVGCFICVYMEKFCGGVNYDNQK